ncbi:phage tail length tape measure family protein [Aureimonas sp. ME7]|uniref:phage tail length tape measure family protein n=1 Tax=Aureimonas sp. ME7 TaxID=2744252 RepID=UPI0015F91366|nr:phage tail length tape measure family protein [Aureimonas sp. ME7]
MANRTVTTATFRAEEQGVSQTAAALGKLQGAAGGAARGVENFTRSTDSSAKKIGTVEREVDRLQRQLAGAPAAWTAYERGVRAATTGLDAGKLTVEQYQRSIQGLQQQLQRVVAPQLKMDVDASGLTSILGNTAKVSAAQREAAKEALRNAQAQQSAIKDQAEAQAQLAVAAAKLKAELDPLSAAQTKLNSELAQYDKLLIAGTIDAEEMSKATALANQRFKETADKLKPANDNLKLSSHQVTNLGYQLNDIGTMLAMGANPFQIIASQAGQVVQALGDHPKGVRGSLKAIGTSALEMGAAAVRALGPVGTVLAGLGVAATAYAMTLGEKIPTATEALDKQAKALKALEDRYGSFGGDRRAGADERCGHRDRRHPSAYRS